MDKKINNDAFWAKIWIGASILMGGYIIGRLTAVKDLKDGKLNMFIPKQ